MKLRHNNAWYRIPSPAELPDRVHVVLTVIYLIYTQGHQAAAGPELVRRDLTGGAVRLARLVHELIPDEPEAAGPLALVVLTESRADARFGHDGELVRLADQDRTRWNDDLTAEGQPPARDPQLKLSDVEPLTGRRRPDPLRAGDRTVALDGVQISDGGGAEGGRRCPSA